MPVAGGIADSKRKAAAMTTGDAILILILITATWTLLLILEGLQ